MRFGLSLFFSLIIVSSLSAETRLVLGNGDSLRGKVVKVEDGVIYFQSEALGLLTLPSSGVILEETDPAKSVTSALPGVDSTEPTEVTQPETNPDAPVVAKKAPWKKNVEFGFTLQSGRKDKMDISGRFTAQRNIKQDQYRLQARYLYSETNSVNSNDLLNTFARWRRDLSPRMFTQAMTAYGFDQIKHINHDFSQGIGVGRKFYNLDTFTLSLGGGATARYRDENGDPAALELYGRCLPGHGLPDQQYLPGLPGRQHPGRARRSGQLHLPAQRRPDRQDHPAGQPVDALRIRLRQLTESWPTS